MAAAASISKVALVTASSAGLGAAAVQAFATQGYRVVVNYNSSAEKAQAIIDSIQKSSTASTTAPSSAPRHVAIKADVSQQTEIRRLVDETVSAMGRLDVVVSNQGWTRMRNFMDLEENVDESDWDGCFNMNVKSHLWLFHAAKPHLKQSEGCFVSVASMAGLKPSGSSIPYSVTKAAQIHLIKTLAKISGPEIRVNSVAPGILMTEWGKKFPQATLDAAIGKTSLGRLATVEDVVDQILVFANSRSITGVITPIDCGWQLY